MQIGESTTNLEDPVDREIRQRKCLVTINVHTVAHHMAHS